MKALLSCVGKFKWMASWLSQGWSTANHCASNAEISGTSGPIFTNPGAFGQQLWALRSWLNYNCFLNMRAGEYRASKTQNVMNNERMSRKHWRKMQMKSLSNLAETRRLHCLNNDGLFAHWIKINVQNWKSQRLPFGCVGRNPISLLPFLKIPPNEPIAHPAF